MWETWGGKSTFDYTGSVETGTEIIYGQGYKIRVTAAQYKALRRHFLHRIVPVGTSRTNAPRESLGSWLQANVTRVAVASYVAQILVLEGFAERVGKNDIHITR